MGVVYSLRLNGVYCTCTLIAWSLEFIVQCNLSRSIVVTSINTVRLVDPIYSMTHCVWTCVYLADHLFITAIALSAQGKKEYNYIDRFHCALHVRTIYHYNYT